VRQYGRRNVDGRRWRRRNAPGREASPSIIRTASAHTRQAAVLTQARCVALPATGLDSQLFRARRTGWLVVGLERDRERESMVRRLADGCQLGCRHHAIDQSRLARNAPIASVFAALFGCT